MELRLWDDRSFQNRCPRWRQRNHIGFAIRAFLRLEMHWFTTGVSGYETKLRIVREAVRSYLQVPTLTLGAIA
ncbi:MAG TPA: hypothetical protein ACFE0H_02110 [Elainellaceae cyanobacterium]